MRLISNCQSVSESGIGVFQIFSKSSNTSDTSDTLNIRKTRKTRNTRNIHNTRDTGNTSNTSNTFVNRLSSYFSNKFMRDKINFQISPPYVENKTKS